MLQILVAPANAVSLRVQHRIEPDEMARVVRAVEAVLRRHDKARVCLEIECWDEWTLIELACDFRAAFDHLPDFEREVLIADAPFRALATRPTIGWTKPTIFRRPARQLCVAGGR